MILLGKPERKDPLGRPRREWIILKSIIEKFGWGVVYLIYLSHERNW
jgi:hypothetical protein